MVNFIVLVISHVTFGEEASIFFVISLGEESLGQKSRIGGNMVVKRFINSLSELSFQEGGLLVHLKFKIYNSISIINFDNLNLNRISCPRKPH